MDAHGFLPDEQTLAAIRREIQAYEARRAGTRMSVRWRMAGYLVLVLAAAVAIAYVFNGLADPNEQWASTPHVFLYVVAVIAMIAIVARALRPAAALDRSGLFKIAFGFIDGLAYRKGARPRTFEKLPREVIGTHDRERFDDVFSGTYQGFAFELYEAVLKDKVGGDEITQFHGIVMAFQTEQSFPGLLVATRKTSEVKSIFGSLFGERIVELDSGVAELDERYDFRTDNAEAAAPLVRGRLAQALQWLGESWPGEPARVALQGTDGFLLLPTVKDFFELPPADVPLDYAAHIEPLMAEMASLLATAALVRKVGGAEG